jgi:hypothetical protein
MDNTGSCCSTAIAAPPRELWLYYSTNLQVDKNVDVLTPIWKRAAAAGYSKVLLTDSKFAKLGDLGEAAPRYLANAKKARLLAEELHLGLVPAVFSVGYSNSMLWHDPNLAEGLRVEGSLFVVHDGIATLVADPPVALDRITFKDADSNKSPPGTMTASRNRSVNGWRRRRVSMAWKASCIWRRKYDDLEKFACLAQ